MNRFILNGISETIAQFVGKYYPVTIEFTANMPEKDANAIFSKLNSVVIPASLVGISMQVFKKRNDENSKNGNPEFGFVVTVGKK